MYHGSHRSVAAWWRAAYLKHNCTISVTCISLPDSLGIALTPATYIYLTTVSFITFNVLYDWCNGVAGLDGYELKSALKNCGSSSSS